MVTGTLLSVSITLFTALFACLMTAALWIWRHRANLTDEEERITEVERERRERIVSNFAQLIAASLDAKAVVTDGGRESLSVEEQIEEEIETADVVRVIEEWNRVGAAREIYDGCLDAYETAYKNIALAALGVISLSVVIISVRVAGNQPFSASWDIAHGSIGLLSSVFLYKGIRSFNEAQDLENELSNLERGTNE